MENTMETDGYKFVLADGDVLKQCHHLRHDVYASEFKFESENIESLEIDKYDDRSIHLACIEPGGNVIGTVRLIFDEGDGLPIDQYIQINEKVTEGLVLSRDCAEISRLTFQKRHRGSIFPKMLIDFAFVVAKEFGLKRVFLIAQQEIIDRYRSEGFSIQEIGVGVPHHGRIRIPCMVNIETQHLEK